jgi:hypothetical protein
MRVRNWRGNFARAGALAIAAAVLTQEGIAQAGACQLCENFAIDGRTFGRCWDFQFGYYDCHLFDIGNGNSACNVTPLICTEVC